MKYFISFLLVVSTNLLADGAEKFAPKSKAMRLEEKIDGRIFDGPLYDSSSSGPDKNNSYIGVNSYLWRGSLEAVSFLPKDRLDPFGGTISTQWHALPEAPKEQFRIEIVILSQQMRSDAVKVSIFKRTKDRNGNWKDVSVDPETVEKFEEAILTKARAIRIAEERK